MKRSGRVVPVHLADWEVGCCVPPFGIGDEVSWALAFVEAADDGFDPGSTTRRWRAERNGRMMLLVDGPLAATFSEYAAPPPAPGECELTGWLCADFHSGYPPTARGRVRRIRVTTALLGPTPEGPDRTLSWVPGSTWSYEVAGSPAWFGQYWRDDGEAHRRQTGYLVDLEITPRRAAPGRAG